MTVTVCDSFALIAWAPAAREILPSSWVLWAGDGLMRQRGAHLDPKILGVREVLIPIDERHLAGGEGMLSHGVGRVCIPRCARPQAQIGGWSSSTSTKQTDFFFFESKASFDFVDQRIRFQVTSFNNGESICSNVLSHDRARSHRQFLCPRCSNSSSNPGCRR